MPMLEDLELDTGRITAVFKGPSKSGKTVALATFPKPMYIFDCDGRMKPLAMFYAGTPVMKDIEYDTYRAQDFKLFDKKVEEIQRQNKYATVVVDSLTTCSTMIMNYSMELRGKETGAKRKADDYKHRGVIDLPEIEDFGAEAQALQDIVDFGRSLKSHFILTAHVIVVTQTNIVTRETTITRSMLTAGKKIAEKLPACFDEIWHFNVRPAVRVTDPPSYEVYTSNAGEDFAGTALPLPHVMDWTNRRDFYPMVQDHIKKFLAKQQTVKPVTQP